MKRNAYRLFLFFALAAILVTGCSKDSETVAIDPPPDSGRDTTRPGGETDTSGNGGGPGGGTGGGNNSNGVTLMRGTDGVALFYSHSTDGRLSRYLSHDGFATLIRLDPDSSASMRIKLVNADKATVTVTKFTSEIGYTRYEMNFSNASYFTSVEQANHPDTAGKLQVWITRDDGQNIIPAKNGKPAVKRIIQIPGWFPSDPQGYGLIRFLDYDYAGYPVRKPEVTLAVLQDIFSKTRWSSDVQILAKLAARGLHMSPQKLSATWRIPFYAGIIINRLIDEPAIGNWEPLVSIEDFQKVQVLLESGTLPGNHAGYTHNKDVKERPLTRLLRCDSCHSYLVGQVVKKKGIHYYRCLKCRGFNLNAHTTKRAQRKGADDLFIDFLKQYQLPATIAPLVKIQIIKLFEHHHAGQSNNGAAMQSQLEALEKKIKNLKIRHGLGEIDKETYDLTFDHLNSQLQVLSAEMNKRTPAISNLEKLVSHSLEKLGNLSVIWASGDLENKRRIQKILFPEGVFYNAEKHQYRTFKVNEFVELIRCYADEYNGNKNANSQSDVENSRFVVPTGIEPVSKV